METERQAMKRWPTKPLGELVAFEKGKKAPEVFPTPTPTSLRYLQIEDLRPNSTFKYCEPFNCPIATNSDVIIAWDGANAGTVSHNLAGHIGSTLAVLRPIAGNLLSSAFLSRFLEGNFNYLQRTATGATIPHVSKDALKGLYIPVPPLAEQERIVKLLDEADELRKLRAQADRRTADLIPALFHDMFGRHVSSPSVLVSHKGTSAPKGWSWSRLTDVARLATGHTPSRRVSEYWNGTIPWISLTDIRTLDGTVAQNTSQSVTDLGIENSSSVKLPKGTVCFSRTASVGFVTVMGREMCTSQDFVNWVCGNRLDPIYLMSALIQARDHLRSLASGSTHKTIYFPTVEQFRVLVPPLSLQREFAARVSEIRAMQAEQAASRRRLDDLFQSMLHRAFNGEL